MKKYLAGLAAVSVAGGAAPTLDSVQAAPEQNTQKAATTVQASASNSSSYKVNADVLHVRAGSSTSHDIISRVYNGQSLNVIGEENGWYKININGKTGFVSGEFVSKNGASNSNVSTTGGKNKVTADVLRVRTAPNTSSSVSGRVYEGQTLNVIGQENGWVKINHNGQVGYVSGEFVSGVSSNAGSSNNNTNNNNQESVKPASGNYTVNVSSLRVRTGPSTSHTTVGSVTKGQVVQVVGEVQDWFKINYAGQTAYVSKDYVTKGGSSDNATQGNNQNNNQNNNVTVQTGGTYVVNATSLRVRTGPATYHSVIGGVLNGTTLNVIGSEGSWFKVNYQGKTGYVSSEFTKFVKGGTTTPEQPKQPEKPNQGAIGDYYINASALNVRSGEGTNYRIIGALPQGQKVQVISENSGWSKINYNGQTGYIGTRYLSKTPVGGAIDNKPNNNNNNNNNSNNNNNNSGDSSSILAYAKSMQGVPYVWGGTSANGVDCSGYIYHVFKKFGHNISRQSVAGYWGSLPQTSNPQPGDLIYFQNTYKSGPSHMGIYLGGGSFIQAGDKGVAIASLSNSYWKSHFLGYTKAP
ncbi:cell wall hydrolase, possible N-acetylmuramoyl-L-alanine amidase [Bacillus cereus ATCC 4342]|uniref:C40 family peptidase n=1 Tax=Bacillus tropicus TaxID=2026188 RepID=UPI0001A0051E|nr:SH3 domain-containing protein [Bacillus tropicus]AJH72319.1 cell wall hydrolase [Bacillus cereus ATCC 4342]EEK81550.1 Enterotoxin [Bacillus cereus ATCC 4342]KFM91830.1 cell wall hydrolase, possible N-acetylmuramoyl-L-alanine amidase [Bacillus cereus ATCC 4342]MDR4457026.1 SH3 domain-containing protein [Bacillus tropicus]QKH55114.1 SH3 domain-containing protein [Bacillus tropicus]